MTSPTVPWRPLHAMLVAVVLATGCASTTPSHREILRAEDLANIAVLPSVPLPPELDRVLRDYETAWTARSPVALADLFTEDGFVLQGGRPPVRGRDGILRAYTGSGGPLALRALAYTTDGNVGYIVGAYSAAVGQADTGKFILLVRRAAPEEPWKIAADMDNGNPRRR